MRTYLAVFGVLLAVTLTGCSDENDAGSLGESLGENVTEFAKGVGSGIDAQLKVEIELSESLTNSGVTATVAKQDTPLDSPDKPIIVYFISSKPVEATLIAKAYDGENQEIGRASTDVTFKADDAQYIKFSFPTEMDRQTVSVYRIDVGSREPAGDQGKDADSDAESGA